MYRADWDKNLQPYFHQHNDLELGILESGSGMAEIGGRQIRYQRGQVVCFWSAMPHRILEITPPFIGYTLTLPTPWILHFQLPPKMISRLLDGECFCDPHPSALEQEADILAFHRWYELLSQNLAESNKIILLEAEARIRRLIQRISATPTAPQPHHPSDKVAAMVRYLTEHYTEQVRVTSVAAAVGLSPKYAITLFQKACGVSMVDHLNQLRTHHAQRLLATTDAKMVEIALESGFGSLSRFHTVFKRSLGMSPKQFQKSLTFAGGH
jgi:AraC-like DNA-binding protein